MGTKTQTKRINATAATTIHSEIDTPKIENITQGLAHYCFNMLHNRLLSQNRDNAMIICDYIIALKHEINLSDNYRDDIIMLLSRFSSFNKAMSFRQISREDILAFLDSIRRTEASYNSSALQASETFGFICSK